MNAEKGTRVAIYARVSTDKQTVEMQLAELREIATRRGWPVASEYIDQGVSGAKGRDKRPELDRLLGDAARRKFDMVMVWKLDRFGRSMLHVLNNMEELRAHGVDFYSCHDSIDTSTPMGKFTFHLTAAFAELERDLIRERTAAGIARARKQGKRFGRPKVPARTERAIQAGLAAGTGMRRLASELGVGVSVVQRVKRETGVGA